MAEEKTTKNDMANMPDDFKGKGTKKLIEDTLVQIKDLATLEVRMPVEARLRERMKSIKEMGSAKTYKIQGHHSTKAPEIHIHKLTGRRLAPDHAEITFSVFESDKDGNKKLHEQKTIIEKEDGSKIKRTTSAEYRIAYDVKETIKANQPIQREIIKFDLPGEQ
jgi:hypothetical protein